MPGRAEKGTNSPSSKYYTAVFFNESKAGSASTDEEMKERYNGRKTLHRTGTWNCSGLVAIAISCAVAISKLIVDANKSSTLLS